MQEFDIRAIIYLLLGKVKWIVSSLVIGALLFGAYTKYFTHSTYVSQVQMYVSNYSDLTNAPGASTGNLSASQALVNEYIVILKNDVVLTQVVKYLSEHENNYVMTNGAVRGAVSMYSVDESAMLNISATTSDPALSKAICDAYCEVAPVKLKEIMEMGSVKTMEPAKMGTEIRQSVASNAMLGALVGAVISCGIFILMYMLDDTVIGERELKRRLNVAVLGEVPSLQPSKKGEKKNGRRK